jgi:predicted extracellular nuclease
MQQNVAAQAGPGIVISEFRFRGPNGGNDEFVELFNASMAPINVGGWMIRGSNNNMSPSVGTRAIIPAGTIIPPGCFFLAVNTAVSGYSGSVAGNLTYATGIADDGGVALTTNVMTQIVDQVGFGSNGAFGEGQRLTAVTTNVDRGFERRPGGGAGHVDTNDNATDFREITPGNPQNASSTCLTPGSIAITASVSPSPVEQGQSLTVFGLVFPGSVPTSTGVQVAGDLTAVGGSAATVLADNGVAPDVVAGDNIYTASVTVPAGNPLGAQSVTLSVSDAQGRTATHAASVTVNPPPVIYLPHEVQGNGAMSPFPAGTSVTVRGVVTARKFNGFFVQTEPGMEDADANTSEGLFVFVSGGAPAAAQVGHVVHVTGAVAEFVPGADPGSAPLTELSNVTAVIDLGPGAVPAPYELTSAELSDAGSLDQLERFEGMRVRVASLTATSGTGGNTSEANATSTSDGTFFAVLTGQARPFREPGVESGYPVLPCAVGPCNVPLFDGNPERLRVDTDALVGVPAANVSTGAVMTDVVGPLDFAFRTYTLLPESPLVPVGGMSVAGVAGAAPNQFTVASFNMERFFDTTDDPGGDVALTPAALQLRLTKASLAIRLALNNPDIVAVQEVENLAVLWQLAQQIDGDAVAAGQPAPMYVPRLVEGNDPGGIDVGFLVKQRGGRVQVLSVEQVGATATFIDPSDGSEDLLNDRPPLVLRATVSGPSQFLPQTLTVIVNHLRSLLDAELATGAGVRVRAKRQAQAEFLADLIQTRQSNDPNEAIVSVGDYNAFSFNDGYGDSIGAILGTPASPDQVATASPDLVSPDLVNLSDMAAPAERYSFVFNGNAQTLDHILATANLVPQFAGVARARINADFPEVLRGDATTPSRLSDHDPVVAYFTFPPDVTAPVLGNMPGDHVVEAVGPAGAPVTFVTPTATDNLDVYLYPVCSPASGSTFPLGNTGVTCSVQDEAGNEASAAFTVTVRDTTAPALVLPASVSATASGAAGAVVTFNATATDAVTPSPLANCTPASGSTFAVGDTVVTCTAADAAGNVATGSFTVTVTVSAPPASTPGQMAGAGEVRSGHERALFMFTVRESARRGERGVVMVQFFDTRGQKTRYHASATDVQFSNADGFSPGRKPRSGVDSVVFSGLGSWNGVDGYRFTVSAADKGEPGRGQDTFEMNVFGPRGNLVKSIQGVLVNGNIQSIR